MDEMKERVMAEHVAEVTYMFEEGDFAGFVKVTTPKGLVFAVGVADGLRVRVGDTVLVDDGGSNSVTVDGRLHNVPLTVTKVVKGPDYEEFVVGDDLSADECRGLPDGAVVLSVGSMNGRYTYSVYRDADTVDDEVMFGWAPGKTTDELPAAGAPFKVIWLGAPWAAKEEN